MKILSGILLIVVILAAVLNDKKILVSSFKEAGPVALALTCP